MYDRNAGRVTTRVRSATVVVEPKVVEASEPESRAKEKGRVQCCWWMVDFERFSLITW